MTNPEDALHTVDAGMLTAAVGVMMGFMPAVAAVLTAAWLAARLYNEIMTGVYRARDRRARKAVTSGARHSPAPGGEPPE